MTNPEIDLAIELLVNPEFQHAWDKKGHDRYWVAECLPRYTRSWGMLMPLIIEHEISLVYNFSDGNWDGIGDLNTSNHNPQRALAECLLLVLQSKKGK